MQAKTDCYIRIYKLIECVVVGGSVYIIIFIAVFGLSNIYLFLAPLIVQINNGLYG